MEHFLSFVLNLAKPPKPRWGSFHNVQLCCPPAQFCGKVLVQGGGSAGVPVPHHTFRKFVGCATAGGPSGRLSVVSTASNRQQPAMGCGAWPGAGVILASPVPCGTWGRGPLGSSIKMPLAKSTPGSLQRTFPVYARSTTCSIMPLDHKMFCRSNFW